MFCKMSNLKNLPTCKAKWISKNASSFYEFLTNWFELVLNSILYEHRGSSISFSTLSTLILIVGDIAAELPKAVILNEIC